MNSSIPIRTRRNWTFVFPASLFLLSLGLRLYFFCGFVLGDDAEEIPLFRYIIERGVHFDFPGPLSHRFAVWIFNVLTMKIFGISETSFFVPTWLMSASLSVIGYLLLVRWNYSKREAFLAGLFIATAPYEVLIASVRANDLIFAWFIALALLAFVYFKDKPIHQGASLAVLLWFGFYTKLWVVYFLPALGAHYLATFLRRGEWRSCAVFTAVSGTLHFSTAFFWKWRLGTFIPFMKIPSATYPVPREQIMEVWKAWPRMLFSGYDFGTTLFGYIPYLLLIFLGIKSTILCVPKPDEAKFRFDRADALLFSCYMPFFLLLNFFPQNFKFDQYYSMYRTFRYLAPLSFPMALHVGKMLLDLLNIDHGKLIKRRGAAALLLALSAVNLVQAAEATWPGRSYRKILMPIVQDLRHFTPPKLLAENWLICPLMEMYLKGYPKNVFVILPGVGEPRDYQTSIEKKEKLLPEGSLLLTGFGNYVYYGCGACGYRLNFFNKPLGKKWKLIKEYGTWPFVARPEPARLWRLSQLPASAHEI